MKKLWNVLLVMALALVCVFVLPRQTEAASVSDLTFTLNGDRNSYSVTDCYTSASGELVIPATYNGKPVTTIGGSAFRDCTSLTSVTIGDSVLSIGEWAFYNCDSLTSVTIGDSVTTIGNHAFRYCDSLTSVTIPDSVTTIGEFAFYYCTSLMSVTIPDSVTTIGDYAFQYCDSLTGIWVDVNNTAYSSDDRGVLLNKAKTTLIQAPGAISGAYTILDSMTTVGNHAFGECNSLTSVTIPDGVTTIGNYAFHSCDSLTSVTIPDSVTTIGYSAFSDCDSLTDVYVKDIYAWWNIQFGNSDANPMYYGDHLHILDDDGKEVTELVLDDSLTEIPTKAFYGCPSLTSVTIPDSVLSIGNSAFSYCSSLTSVTIPDSVTTIGSCAFDSCTSLTSVTIPDSVTTIGNSAFYNCDSLTSVTIPDSVTTIGNSAFLYCDSLTSVTIGDSVTTVGKGAFYYCTSLTSITIPDSVTTIGDYAFCECYSLTSVTIPDSVTTIGDYAFCDCDSLTSITIPDSVTTIGSSAFSGCGSLETITLPFVGGSRKTASDTWQYPFGYIFGTNSYTGGVATTQMYLGSSTSSTTSSIYYIPSSLKSVTITGGEILYGAFYNCRSLTSITIPDSVISIGDYAFKDCDSLTSVIIPDSVTNIGWFAFWSCSRLTSVTIGDSVTSIENGAFSDCNGLTSVHISDIATWCNISFDVSNPLDYAENLYLNGELVTELEIPNTVTSIGNEAFKGYTSLTSVTIPDSVTTIGEWAFCWCDSLTSVTIGDSVTTIGDSAFSFCHSLTSVTIGDSVTTIGEGAFCECYNLTTVTIPDSVTTIGEGAFRDCTSLTDVYYAGTSTQWRSIRIGTSNDRLTSAKIHYSHIHDYSLIPSVTVEPTCTEDGYIEYTCAFGEKYREAIPALGHDYSIKHSTIQPTCTEQGYTEYKCIRCNMTEKREWTDDLGHEYSIKGNTVQPTCIKRGYTEYKCIRCDMTEKRQWTTALGHDCTGQEKTIEPTCTTSGSSGHICTRCGNYQAEQTFAALGHNMVKVEAKEPTCTGKGNGVGTQCSRCQMYGVQPEEIPALGHMEVINQAVPATCTTTGLTEGKHCSRCDEVLIAQQVAEPLGHYVLQGGKEMVDSYTTENDATYPFVLSNNWYASANKNHSTTSTYTISAVYDCTLVLKYKVSSESNCDKLQIIQNSTTKDTISGSVSEKTLTLTLKAGDRVYIKYSKDSSVSNGADTGYFKIYSCTQTEIDTTVRISTNDIEPGCEEGVVCSDCKQKIKEATGHSHNAFVTAPTCLTEGYTTHTCHCGDTYVADQVEALGHSFTSYESNNDATCLEDGTETAKCDRCEETHTRIAEGSATGHSHNAAVTAPTCLNKGYTTHTCHCGDTYVDSYVNALDHSYTTYKSNNNATCTADGTETAKCDRCDETNTRIAEGSATGHSHNAVVTAPTCLDEGYTTYTCHCGDTYVADQVEALGHSFTSYESNNDATCLEDGTETAKCDRCEEVHTRTEMGSAKGHSYTKKVTKPTCTAKGYTTYTCSCGDTYKADYVNAKGHSYAAATCTKAKICKVCKATSGNALGHSYKSGSCIRCKYKPAGAKITTQPKSVKLLAGKQAKLTVKATGTGLKYTWYYAKKGATKWTKTSTKTATFTTGKMSASLNGCRVYCLVTDAYGNSVKSATATLYLINPAKIVTQPTNAIVAKGKTAKVTVKATGDGLKYTWYYATKGAKKWTKTTNTTNTYSVKMASKWNGCRVYCVVTDKYGNTVKTSVATLYMGKAAKITTQPKNVSVKINKTAKVTIKATGDGLKYTWYYADKGATKWTKATTKSSYSVKMTTKVNGRRVYCVVTDKYGTTVKSNVVTLKKK